MKERINKLESELKCVNKKCAELDALRDKIICDEHYDVISKQYGCLSDYAESLIEVINFEKEYFKAIGLLD